MALAVIVMVGMVVAVAGGSCRPDDNVLMQMNQGPTRPTWPTWPMNTDEPIDKTQGCRCHGLSISEPSHPLFQGRWYDGKNMDGKQTPSPTLTLVQNISFSTAKKTSPVRKPSHGMIVAGHRELSLFEGSLEVKLPTIWTDEKQSRAEAERRERSEERREEEKE